MPDIIVLFVAVVDVGKFFFLGLNPSFNQVFFSRRLPAGILSLKRKRRKACTMIKSMYGRYNRFFYGSC